MNNNELYWIWFSQALGPGSKKARELYSYCSDISLFYLAKEREWSSCGIFNNMEVKKLSSTSLSEAKYILKECKKQNIDVITIESENYPDPLKEIYNPPSVLYVKGKLPDFKNNLSIAIVGTRRSTDYGVRTAYRFAYNLAKYGIVIVSGGAVGIDSASHYGALKAEGKTVAVLGCGIDYDYPKSNKKMRDSISESGALISEYPPGTEPRTYHYPLRNRLIPALSNGIIVVEAGMNSGALSTASYAVEQGKDVFSIMGNIDSPTSRGTNELIRDGAIPALDFRDVLNYYPNLYSISEIEEKINDDEISAIPVKGRLPDRIGNKKVRSASVYEDTPVFHKNAELEEFALKVYESIDSKPIHIDDLAVKISVPLYKLLPVITELELKELIIDTGGKYYKLK